MTRGTTYLWMALALAGCTCGEPTVAPEPAPTPTPAPQADPLDPVPEGPNVLVILWDTVRADRMSLYGHTRPTTPKLDAFAEDAAVFENAISPGMWTLPTHASFFTGLPPQTHGANATHRWLDDHHETLAERFDEAGWDTFAFSSNLVAGQLMNVTQGFDKQFFTYKEPYKAKARAATMKKLIQADESTEMSPSWEKGTERDADFWQNAVFKDAAPLMSSEFLRWVDERQAQERPFFAYLNFMEAHTPRVPSQSARERVLDAETLQQGLTTDQSLFTEVAWIVGKHEYTDTQMKAIEGVYDASLVDLDDATATLLAGLESRGVLDDTVVVLLSDHGESLGEHHLLEHRYGLWNTLIHVPLVIRYPDKVPAGRRADTVSTMDLFATLHSLAGLELPDNPALRSTDLFAEGRDARAFATMQDPYASTLCAVYRAHPDADYEPWLQTWDAVVEDQLKWLASSEGRSELFDLTADPGELTSVHGQKGEELDRMSGLWDAWAAGLTAYDPNKQSERDKRAGRASAGDAAMLEALGYLDGNDGAAASLAELCKPKPPTKGKAKSKAGKAKAGKAKRPRTR